MHQHSLQNQVLIRPMHMASSMVNRAHQGLLCLRVVASNLGSNYNARNLRDACHRQAAFTYYDHERQMAQTLAHTDKLTHRFVQGPEALELVNCPAYLF